MKAPSHKYQARKALEPFLALGVPRHGNSGDGMIHSLGTFRAYSGSLAQTSRWLRAFYGMDLCDLEEGLAIEYLQYRAESVGLKAIDLDRHAMQVVLGQPLPRIRPDNLRNDLACRSRTCTAEQFALMLDFLPAEAGGSVKLAREAGLRAAELLTLLPIGERGPSDRRWDGDRFLHSSLDRPEIFSVTGKGGLVRAVAIAGTTAAWLETRRLSLPARVTDRGIHLATHYDIWGGKRISSIWSETSNRVFGWSNGVHCLRHAFAKQRISELMAAGMEFGRAREVLAQELGHFDPRTTNYYLR